MLFVKPLVLYLFSYNLSLNINIMKKQILRIMNAFIAASTILLVGGGARKV